MATGHFEGDDDDAHLYLGLEMLKAMARGGATEFVFPPGVAVAIEVGGERRECTPKKGERVIMEIPAVTSKRKAKKASKRKTTKKKASKKTAGRKKAAKRKSKS